jgi:hypothetical protein
VHALNFGAVGVRVRTKFWKNVGVRVCTLNFGTARKNVGVQVRALNLALRGVHTHNKVHGVHTHNNGTRGCAQYWQSAEEFGWCTRNVGICCHATV